MEHAALDANAGFGASSGARTQALGFAETALRAWVGD
jgi:hypothetical protein